MFYRCDPSLPSPVPSRESSLCSCGSDLGGSTVRPWAGKTCLESEATSLSLQLAWPRMRHKVEEATCLSRGSLHLEDLGNS